MNPEVIVIKPSGILDNRHSTQLRQEVEAICAGATDSSIAQSGQPITLLIDLADITFIDSTGLGNLVLVFKALQAAGGQLYLCSVGQQVRLLFELTGVDQVFQIFPDQASFEARLDNTAEIQIS